MADADQPKHPAMPTADQPVARRRPVGMVLIAALLLFNLIGTLTSFATTLFSSVGGPIMAIYFLVLSVVIGALLYGFWTFRRWGWTGVLILTAVAMALALAQFFAFLGTTVLVGNLIGVLIGALVVWYLLKSEVRARFDR